MIIVSRPEIHEFIEHLPLSAGFLNEWYDRVQKADWSGLEEVKQSWPACDSIGNDRYVFDIAGNDYRLVALIYFKNRTLYIRKILTQAEYTELSKKGNLHNS